jgi:aryl sulfotransferase
MSTMLREDVIVWPQKTRELHNHHFDSTVWNDFAFRDDDVIIATYAKSGTTWTQQIVGQLLFPGDEGLNIAEMSPWVDLRVPPKNVKLPQLEAMQHRRFLKTHLPVDALVFSPRAKYIYLGRDGRDVVWSLFNHHFNANMLFYELLNDTPGRVGPPIDPPAHSVERYFTEWLDRDGHPFWPFWENIRSWWEIRDLPNVLMLHFSDLKADMEGGIRQIADFLEIDVPGSRWPEIVEHCSFDYMKRNAGSSAPLNGILWDGGPQTFVHKGTNGRWRDTLSTQESDRYERMATWELGHECAAWLQHGSKGLR